MLRAKKMELLSTDASREDFFLEPLQYVFRDEAGEWAVSFIPTVPHGAEAQQLFGDLFECRIRDITFGSTPVAIGSDGELSIIEKLQYWADANKSREEQDSLRFSKFPRMTNEMVGWQTFLWFVAALRERRTRQQISN